LNRGGGNYNNALAAGKLRYFEPARPLLDEDVAELHLRLPQDVLTQKWIFHRLIEWHYPELSKFPYATEGSIPVAETFRSLLNQSEMFFNFVRCNLVETMDSRLEELLNKAALSRFIDTIRREGSIAVAYYRWFHRLPGGWRMIKTPSAPQLNPIMVMLRLLQINLFLKEISKAE
jgi:hypothetical protein